MTKQIGTGTVVVLDGRPRYHLADCRSVAGKGAQALPLALARSQGFTPCGTCKPDAVVAPVRVPRAAPVARPALPALDWASPPTAPARRPAAAEPVTRGRVLPPEQDDGRFLDPVALDEVELDEGEGDEPWAQGALDDDLDDGDVEVDDGPFEDDDVPGGQERDPRDEHDPREAHQEWARDGGRTQDVRGASETARSPWARDPGTVLAPVGKPAAAASSPRSPRFGRRGDSARGAAPSIEAPPSRTAADPVTQSVGRAAPARNAAVRTTTREVPVAKEVPPAPASSDSPTGRPASGSRFRRAGRSGSAAQEGSAGAPPKAATSAARTGGTGRERPGRAARSQAAPPAAPSKPASGRSSSSSDAGADLFGQPLRAARRPVREPGEPRRTAMRRARVQMPEGWTPGRRD